MQGTARRITRRIRQFVRGVTASVSAEELQRAAQILPPAGLTRFQQMPVDAQRHSLNVLSSLQGAGWNDADLAAAALLHDAGKLAAWLTAGGAITWLAAGFVVNHPDCRHDPCTVETIVGVAGVAVFDGSRIWASVSAWKLANRTNAFYRRRLGIEDAGLVLSVTPNGQLGLGASLRF